MQPLPESANGETSKSLGVQVTRIETYLATCFRCKHLVKYVGDSPVPHTKSGVEITCKEFALHEEGCDYRHKV